MSTWLDAARRFARDRGLDPADADLLGCFAGPKPRGGPPPPPEDRWSDGFEALERLRLSDSLEHVARALCPEVDQAQAALFGRRVGAVDQALAGLGDDFGRLLRVGLRQRVRGIVASPHARATRIRALADFYFSYVGLHMHRRRGAGGPPMEALVQDVRWHDVRPGLRHARIEGHSDLGPLHVNLLEVDPRRVRITAEDCRASVERGVPFASHVEARGAVAGVSGGFFLYSEPDIQPPSRRFDPVGLLMSDGVVLSPPALARGAVLTHPGGEASIAPVAMTDVEIRAPSGQRIRPAAVVNRSHARVGPDVRSAAIVGTEVLAVGTSLAVPLNGFVIPLPAALALREGDRVDYLEVRAAAGPVRDGIAGGPMLLRDGEPRLEMREEDFWGSAPPVTFSQDETGDRNLLPRLAAGLRPDGTLVLAAVDGRNFDRALGMTLGGVGRLLASLGCRVATNLDGGSSKRMVLEGRALDLASTEIVAEGVATVSVRPVHTALLLFAEGP